MRLLIMLLYFALCCVVLCCVVLFVCVRSWSGADSCAGDNMVKIMKSGCNIGLIPGGFQEATCTKKSRRHNFILPQHNATRQPPYLFTHIWRCHSLIICIILWMVLCCLTVYRRGEHHVYLKKRKGFIKVYHECHISFHSVKYSLSRFITVSAV